MLEHQYLLESIGSKLKLMNETYFSGNSKEGDSIASPFLGSSSYINNDFTKESGNNPYVYFFNKIFNNKVTEQGVSITDTSAAGVSSPVDDMNKTSQKVYVFTEGSQNYTEYTPSGTNTWKTLLQNIDTLKAVDINCMDLLIDNTNRNGPVPELYKFMQGLYGLYNLLEPVKWQRFCSGQLVTFSIPDKNLQGGSNIVFKTVTLDNASSSTTMNSGIDIKIAMSNIFDYLSASMMNKEYPVKFNPFIARRLMHMYIMMIQCEIALKMYVKNYGTSSRDNLASLFRACRTVYEQTNVNVQKPGGIVTTYLNKTREMNIGYDNLTTLIKEENENVEENKKYYISQRNKFDERTTIQKSEKMYQFISLAVLIVVLTSGALLLVSPIEYSRKLIYGVLLSSLTLLFSWLINYMFIRNNNLTPHPDNFTKPVKKTTMMNMINKNKEGFAIRSEDVNAINDINLYEFDEVLFTTYTYINNTILLNNILDINHLYGNTLFSMGKEAKYYMENDDILDNAGKKMHSLAKLSYGFDITYNATMRLILALSILMSVTLLLYIASEAMPKLQQFIFILSIIIGIGLVVVYILVKTSYVRTDPSKLYWSTRSRKND